jgi:myosin heavy subunit
MTECDPECLSSDIDNLIKLNNLNESAILHNLRVRFKEDVIYTYVSSILISVNPFKLLPLYTPEMLDKYKEQGSRNLPPHVFATADNAYKQMLSENESQSCVISGESGAGKTEATKLILQFVAEVSGRAGGSTEGSIEQQILQANPVMEAFGNAKTTRNNNSSRFGKLISIKFDAAGAIVGGQIHHYLLEKVRVTTQNEQERNYHIFYQILAGVEADPELKTALGITEAEDYHYTNQSGVTSIEGLSDEKEFEDVLNASNTLQISKENQLDVWKIVAGVLNMGNVEFVADVKATEEDGAKMKDDAACQAGATLWGVEAAALGKSLTSRNIGTRSVILVSYTVEQAADARDALTKAIFSKTFDWLIVQINKALAGGKDLAAAKGKEIHVLDIFGFESFDTNSFEQLCINFCNEKLQFHFNEHIFTLEQEEYAKEGVSVDSTDFVDNQACLDLLEKARTGIFSMIDEEISVPKGSDDGLLQKCMRDHGKHKNFKRPKPKSLNAQKCFNIIHFAGEVSYNTTNFLEKNKDSLHADIAAVVQGSTSPLVAEIMAAGAAGGGAAKGGRTARSGAKKKQPTLGAQFKAQLNSLMTTLNTTFPHFVRCMKSNDAKKGDIFTAERMLQQLRYAGLLEVCRIRQIGFPVRREFDSFFKRFKCIAPEAKNLDALLAALVEKKILLNKEFQKGTTKVFMRNKMSNALEEGRESAFEIQTVAVQREIRGLLMRVNFRRYKATLDNIKKHADAKAEAELEEALNLSAELPNKGAHIQIVIDGRKVLLRLQEEGRVVKLMENAIGSKNLADCESAVAAAKGMDPPFDHEKVAETEAMIAHLIKEKKLQEGLSAALAARDYDKICTLLEEAAGMGMEGDVVNQCQALKVRLEEEISTVKDLKNAIETENFSEITAFLEKMAELGMESKPEYAEGMKKKAELQAAHEAKQGLLDAIEQRDEDLLNNALAKAASLKLGDGVEEVKNAKALVDLLKKEQAVAAKLTEASDKRDLAAISAALAEAEGLGMKAESHPKFAAGLALKEQLEGEEQCKKDLVSATSSNDPGALAEALAKATELGLSGKEVDDASAASKKLGAANEALSALQTAIDSNDLKTIQTALAKADSEGMGDSPQAKLAKSKIESLKEESAVVGMLKSAAESKDLAALSKAIADAKQKGLNDRYKAEFDAAVKVEDSLGAETKINLQLQSAQKTRNKEDIDAVLAKAAEAGIENEEVAKTKALKDLLVEEDALTEKLKAAMETKDLDQMGTLLREAKTKGMQNDTIKQVDIIVHRDELIEDTQKKIKQATEERDLKLMNEALEKVIELGMEGEEIESAKQLRDVLQQQGEKKAGFVSAMKVAESKRENPAGISPGDLSPLESAIMASKADGIPDDDKDMVSAMALLGDMKKQLDVQKALTDAIASQDFNDLKKVLNDAEDLILKIDSVTKARAVFREVEAQRRRDIASGDLEEEEEEFDEEELERERQERLKKAANAKYHFTNYANIRSVDDFAKGVILNKKKVKEGMLKWQGNVIQKSLLELDKDLSKMAARIHKNILGYMGDKTMSFPATLAQDILQKGLEVPELVDEIYMQIMKQLSNNPKPESIARGWHLMCMCVGTFPPSRDFENHLLNYILEKKDSTGAVGNYGRYSLRRLEGMLSSGASGSVPSVEEIQSYKERPPILATIELVDGTPVFEELPVTPDLNVTKVLEICIHFLDLQDPRKRKSLRRRAARGGGHGVRARAVEAEVLRRAVGQHDPRQARRGHPRGPGRLAGELRGRREGPRAVRHALLPRQEGERGRASGFSADQHACRFQLRWPALPRRGPQDPHVFRLRRHLPMGWFFRSVLADHLER